MGSIQQSSLLLDAAPPSHRAIGGGLEGADRTSRETMLWYPPVRSPDQAINGGKPLADARGRDIVQNDGYASGAVALNQDNIVGAQYRLNAQPNYRALGVSEGWAEDFQEVVEARFNVLADSQDCWLDASRRNTLTGMVRLAVASFVMTGEDLASAEWIREARRPCRTAVQLLSPDRLCNPDGRSDDKYLRRGVAISERGQHRGYWIRNGYPNDPWNDSYTWSYIPAEKPWGRKQMLHIVEQRLPDQTRGVADMVAVLKQMRMTKRFQDVTLQQAVVAATYAAAVESELPPNMVFEQLGGGSLDFGPMAGYLNSYMGALSSYLDESKSIQVDGVKMPHLFPGTKLKIQSLAQPGGIGDGFEQSLLRHIAACLGLSYEQFTRDYTKTNYSSARASMTETWKFMQSRKKAVADRFATFVYLLWLEEEINAGNIPLPRGKNASWFYEPLVKDALGACSWIGASRGQIDELKETQAALLRIKSGLSTYEIEAAKLGMDWRDLFAQRAREERLAAKYKLVFSMNAQQSDTKEAQRTLADDPDNTNSNNEEDEAA
ncbi:phage portal protein [Pseudomonas aeruginosa]